MRVFLISNNPSFSSLGDGYKSSRYYDESVLSVLESARDLIHKGYKLLNHPLYGNYKPYQQPFRSLMLQEPSVESSESGVSNTATVDLESLHLIEEALLVYSQSRVIVPSDAPKKMYDDCRELDFALMQATVQQYEANLTDLKSITLR